MLGYPVDKNLIDMKAAEIGINLRNVFNQVEVFTGWLNNHPKINNVDPLVSEYGYTEDEAYALRVYMESFDAVRANNAETFNIGRKITGLQ